MSQLFFTTLTHGNRTIIRVYFSEQKLVIDITVDTLQVYTINNKTTLKEDKYQTSFTKTNIFPQLKTVYENKYLSLVVHYKRSKTITT